MRISGLTEFELETIRKAIENIPEIESAIIFGSRAKGNFKKGSDVDLAIKGGEITLSTVNSLSYFLNEETLLPYFFDIIHYERISEPTLKEHIDRVGICI